MTTSSQVNYMYGAYVNIKPIVDMNLQGLLGADELLILSYIMQFSANNKCKKFSEDSVEYYMFSPQLIIKQLPILNTKTDKGVKKKINKLIEAGLLDKHKDNQRLRASYYCFGARYLEYKQRCKTIEQKDTTCNKSSNVSSNKSSDTTCNKSSDYNNTIHNNTNNNKESPKFSEFWDIYPSKIDVYKTENYWKNETVGDRLNIIKSVESYNRYLELTKQQAYAHKPFNYIKDKIYLTDWEAEIKRLQKIESKPTEKPTGFVSKEFVAKK